MWRWDREDPGVLSASVGGEVERRLERLGLHVRSIQEDGEDQRAWDYTSGEIEQAPPGARIHSESTFSFPPSPFGSLWRDSQPGECAGGLMWQVTLHLQPDAGSFLIWRNRAL